MSRDPFLCPDCQQSVSPTMRHKIAGHFNRARTKPCPGTAKPFYLAVDARDTSAPVRSQSAATEAAGAGKSDGGHTTDGRDDPDRLHRGAAGPDDLAADLEQPSSGERDRRALRLPALRTDQPPPGGQWPPLLLPLPRLDG